MAAGHVVCAVALYFFFFPPPPLGLRSPHTNRVLPGPGRGGVWELGYPTANAPHSCLGLQAITSPQLPITPLRPTLPTPHLSPQPRCPLGVTREPPPPPALGHPRALSAFSPPLPPLPSPPPHSAHRACAPAPPSAPPCAPCARFPPRAPACDAGGRVRHPPVEAEAAPAGEVTGGRRGFASRSGGSGAAPRGWDGMGGVWVSPSTGSLPPAARGAWGGLRDAPSPESPPRASLTQRGRPGVLSLRSSASARCRRRWAAAGLSVGRAASRRESGRGG